MEWVGECKGETFCIFRKLAIVNWPMHEPLQGFIVCIHLFFFVEFLRKTGENWHKTNKWNVVTMLIKWGCWWRLLFFRPPKANECVITDVWICFVEGAVGLNIFRKQIFGGFGNFLHSYLWKVLQNWNKIFFSGYWIFCSFKLSMILKRKSKFVFIYRWK